MVDKRFAQKLKYFRTKAGLRQEQLALDVGVSTTAISHMELGDTYPSMETFLKIVNCLHISPNDLLMDIIETHEDNRANELLQEIGKLDDMRRQEIYAVLDTMLNFSQKQQ